MCTQKTVAKLKWRVNIMGNAKELIESGKAVLGIEFGSTKIGRAHV